MDDLTIADDDIDSLLDEIQRFNSLSGDLVIDAQRRAAVKDYQNIQACPGSGKTTLVALKLLLLSKKWRDRHAGICVLTHTNVAKDEILKYLRTHPSGYRLLSYPHFIGTIQEFVNAFLAIPYARSRGWEVNLLSSEDFAAFVEDWQWGRVKDLAKGQPRYFTSYFFAKKIQAANFTLTHDNGQLVVSDAFVASVCKLVDTSSGKYDASHLLSVREKICNAGIFQYKEMYALAHQAMHDNPSLRSILQYRFPVVILDEMQDAQKFQDELINDIFGGSRSLVQKLGDPDQAIFDWIGGAEPNESYNNADLVPIIDSHRFTPDIAAKIRGLSLRGLTGLTTSRKASEGGPANTIFLYDDSSIGEVLPHFCGLVSGLPESDRLVVKAVGAIAKDPEEGDLTLKSYWPDFQRGETGQTFKPKSLFDAVKYCCELRAGDIAPRVSMLIQTLLYSLRFCGVTIPAKNGSRAFLTQRSLKDYLLVENRELAFRELLADIVMQELPGPERWADISARIKDMFQIAEQPPEAGRRFIAFDADNGEGAKAQAVRRNIFRSENGVEVRVSTIHSVKGETHDATLILETKYQGYFDISEMIEYFIRDDVDRKKLKVYKSSMLKRLYVAGSRPRHLLCLAVHKSRLSQDQRDRLQSEKGWNIVELQSQAVAN